MTTTTHTFDWEIVDVWDNEEFLTGATVIYRVDGVETHRESFVGTSEEPPGYTGEQLARSAAFAWQETHEYTIEERLGPYGLEWQREQVARATHDFDPDDLPF